MQSALSYRADIQALRAVAVSAAVLFHAKVPGASAGYLGVDIFFVISGFLITGLLYRELIASGGLDLFQFWSRRAWRLLPNACAVLAVVLVVILAVGPVADQRSALIDVGSALTYVANYRFAHRALDYFDDSAAHSLVLHFWSLSVEEQFYIIWPLALVALWSMGLRGRLWMVLAAVFVVVASWAVARYLGARSQPDAFFRTEARLWQLAVGGAVAIALHDAALSRVWRRTLFAVGCLGLAASFSGLHHVVEPVLFAVLPVVSTALILASGGPRSRFAGRLVAFAPLQWLGHRSYSVYLWHWPILAYGTARGADGALQSAGLLGLILLVSALAYRWIETPFRYGIGSAGSRAIAGFIAAGLVAVCMTALFLAGYGRPGGEQAALAQRITAAQADMPTFSRAACPADWQNDALTSCRFGDKRPDRPTVVLIGDSYAQHLFDGVEAAATTAGWSLVMLTRTSCPAVLGAVINEQTGGVDQACRVWLGHVLDRVARDQPDLVIIASWEGASRRMADAASGRRLDRAASLVAWQAGFAELVARLQRERLSVVLVPSTPRGQFSHLDTCLTSALTSQCAEPRPVATVHSQLTVAAAERLAGVQLLDLSAHFCTRHVCHSVRDGMIVYRDRSHHLTATFARQLEPSFLSLLQRTPIHLDRRATTP